MKEKKKSDENCWRYFLLLILILAIFFRFYRINDWIFWGMDQEYEAYLAQNIISLKHFPLIGVNVGDTGLYLGPGFIYFASFLFALFSGNPFGWAIAASVIGVITCCLVYKVGKEMISSKVGLFASLVYSFSFLTAFYDRKFWNPVFVPFFSLMIGYLLFQITNKKARKLLWLAFIYGLALQSHLSLLIFLPLIFWMIFLKRKIISGKIMIISILIFMVLQLPLIIFDFRHNFTNTKAVITLFNKKSVNLSSSLQERSKMFISTLGRFVWLPMNPDLFLESGQCKELANYRKDNVLLGTFLVFGIIFFIYRLFKDNSPQIVPVKRIIIGICLLTILFIIFYNRNVFEYYYLYLFPWLAIIMGIMIDLIMQRRYGKIVLLPLSVFIVFNLLTLFTATFSYSYKDKIQAVNYARNYLGKKDYSIQVVGGCAKFGGYRYLFSYLIHPPSSSYMDSYFSWIYGDISEEKIKDSSQVVLLSLIDNRENTEERNRLETAKRLYLSQYQNLITKQFGDIQLLIFEKNQNSEKIY